MLGFFCYAMYFSLVNKLTRAYLLTICLSFTILIFVRNFAALALIPATLAFIICHKLRSNAMITFCAVYAIVLILTAVLPLINQSFQPIKIISNKQKDFSQLPYASSQLPPNTLEPNLKSFVKNAPQAINHGLFRPYIWERTTSFLIPLAIELLLYQLLFITMLAVREKERLPINAFILFGLFFSFSLLFFTGYIVPNLGSIVRYRSIYLPFLITPILCAINWKKFRFNKY
jgi:hypothetical protein